jgi:hypothetical protein
MLQRSTTALLSALVVILSCLPRGGWAFTCEMYDGENCIRWFEGEATVKSFLGRPSAPLINGTVTWDQNTFLAANDWNVLNAGFRFNVTTDAPFRDPCTTPGPCPGTGAAGENPVIFAASVCGGGSFGPDVIAQTVNCYRLDNGGIVNAPVFFNQNVGWNAYDGNLISGTTDIRRVILHELGHVAGLGHPDDAQQNVMAVMNRRISSIDRPQTDDINSLRFIYAGGSPPPPAATSGGGCSVTPVQRQLSPWALAPILFPLILFPGLRRAARPTRSARPR